MDEFAGKPTSMWVLAEKLRHWMPHVDWPSASEGAGAGTLSEELHESRGDGIIDPAALDELTGGDAELSNAILIDYVDASGSDLAALRAAVADARAEDVRRHAHRIKGASRTVGPHQVATLAARLEAAASGEIDEWPAVRSAAEGIEAAIARVAAMVTSQTSVP